MLLHLVLLAARILPQEAAVPYRQPQLAASPQLVAMTFGGGSSIYFAGSKDQGKTFAAPVKVADTGAAALGRHRGPRVVIAKGAIVISAIAGDKKSDNAHAHGNPENGDLRAWRSTDGGKTWASVGVINDVPGAAREGLHAMSADAKGNVFAVWLDLREKGTRLYGSVSRDGGLTWSKNMQVYEAPGGTICQCCAPSAAFDETGKLYVMWRNVVDGSRDFYVSTSTDASKFTPAEKLGTGTWQINACPMDGGGFAIDKGKVISAWRREESVYLAQKGTEDLKLGDGKDVAMAQTKKGTFVAWTKGSGVMAQVPSSKTPIQLGSEGAFVNLVALPDGGVLAAWEGHGSIETKRLE